MLSKLRNFISCQPRSKTTPPPVSLLLPHFTIFCLYQPTRILRSGGHILAHAEDGSLEKHVNTAEFDQAGSGKTPSHVRHDSPNEPSNSATTIGRLPYEPSEVESNLYYVGTHANGHGPKLIYRDSSDVYEEPYGPEEYGRLMRLVAVPDNHKFSQNHLWETVRDKVHIHRSHYATIF